MLINATSLYIPLPDNSIHAAMTSPPYYGLRRYKGHPQIWPALDGTPLCTGDHEWQEIVTAHQKHGDDGFSPSSTLGGGKSTQAATRMGVSLSGFCAHCGAWLGHLGNEPTPQFYVAHIVQICREVRRVLRPDGTFWLNLGDSYAGSNKGAQPNAGYSAKSTLAGFSNPNTKGRQMARQAGDKQLTNKGSLGLVPDRSQGGEWNLKAKDLMGIPWRVGFALQDDGWYLRSDIVWCLSGGTVVYARTPQGETHMMIRELDRYESGQVELWNGERWTKVLGASKSPRKGDELEIVLRSGERISCTPTHKFPTERGLLAAGDLKVGDRFKRVRLPEPERPRDSEYIGLDAAWLVGLYLAEGSRSGKMIQLSMHVDELDEWNRIQDIARKYGGIALRHIYGKSAHIQLFGKVLVGLIDNFVSGHVAKDKCLAPRCWRYSNAFLQELLEGYLAGDGGWDAPNMRWRLGFARNYNLERDLRILAARLEFRLVLKPKFAAYQGGRKPTFGGEIRFIESKHWNRKATEEVVEIRHARGRWFYDIGVEDEPHLFALASGILTHNSKTNVMPESVDDRPTKSHEYIFLLTKSKDYFYDGVAVMEKGHYDGRKATKHAGAHKYLDGAPGQPPNSMAGGGHERWKWDEEGQATRQKRSVWTVTTMSYSGALEDWSEFDFVRKGKPYRISAECTIHSPFIDLDVPQAIAEVKAGCVCPRATTDTDHYAAWPPDLVRPMILAATSARGVCPSCGAPYRRVMEKAPVPHDGQTNTLYEKGSNGQRLKLMLQAARERGAEYQSDVKTLGWEATCACAAGEPVPAKVLDPFCGSGTTGEVCREHGREFVGLDVGLAYLENLAKVRAEGLTPKAALQSLPMFAGMES